jgi:sterol desaturase/sphingolipid hydroxylase (fatty acid hydroxylase superfamily)
MNRFEHFIAIHGSQLQFIFFIVLFIISWNIEKVAGVIMNYRKWKHGLMNAVYILPTIPVQLLMASAFVKTIHWTTQHQFGFLYHLGVGNNAVLLFLTSFIFLDLGEYLYHIIMHRVGKLWGLHILHHSDKVLDITTTLRVHAGDNFIRLSLTLLWVFISGTAFWVLMLRQIIQSFTTLFAHINFRLPDRIDHILGFIFITPNLHQVHHHYKRPYTNCNYGDVLSIWDRLFGTLKRLPAKDLVFGIDA